MYTPEKLEEHSSDLVYSGKAGGTHFNRNGGGANAICLPGDKHTAGSLEFI